MNEVLVRTWTKGPDAKAPNKKPQPQFLQELADILRQLTDWASRVELERVAHWLLYQHHWLNRPARVGFVRVGNIVEVDLGVNPDGEFSYRHPCVVIRQYGSLLTVIPLTSKADGHGYTLDPTGKISSGPVDTSKPIYESRVDFRIPGQKVISTALIEQVRPISIDRVMSKWKDPANAKRDLFLRFNVVTALQTQTARLLAPDMNSRFNTILKNKNADKNKILNELDVERSKNRDLVAEIKENQQFFAIVERAANAGDFNSVLNLISKKTS